MMLSKRIIFGLMAITMFVSCGDNQKKTTETEEVIESRAETSVGTDMTDNITPSSFGEELSDEAPISSEELFKLLAEKDTVNDVIISGKITSVCQKKGCWMKVDMGNEKELFVKFKDYGFFMPMDCEGSTVLLEGRAYSETISVDELKHYAEDDGQSEEEIAAITEPETSYTFKASGALLTDYVPTSKEPVPTETEGEHDHDHDHDHGHDHDH